MVSHHGQQAAGTSVKDEVLIRLRWSMPAATNRRMASDLTATKKKPREAAGLKLDERYEEAGPTTGQNAPVSQILTLSRC